MLCNGQLHLYLKQITTNKIPEVNLAQQVFYYLTNDNVDCRKRYPKGRVKNVITHYNTLAPSGSVNKIIHNKCSS